jgi:molybdopterin-guanine dinucleotide biosynthesis protein A
LGLLAGGQGARLGGVAKGLLWSGGGVLIDRLISLRPDGAMISVASAPSPYSGRGLREVPDVEAGRGAPGGVVSLLLGATTPWVLVVAADMPFVVGATVAELLARQQAQPEAHVVCFSRGGRFEPLCALYARALGPRWRGRLSENPSLQALLHDEPCSSAPPSEPAWLESVNTPEDLTRLGITITLG